MNLKEAMRVIRKEFGGDFHPEQMDDVIYALEHVTGLICTTKGMSEQDVANTAKSAQRRYEYARKAIHNVTMPDNTPISNEKIRDISNELIFLLNEIEPNTMNYIAKSGEEQLIQGWEKIFTATIAAVEKLDADDDSWGEMVYEMYKDAFDAFAPFDYNMFYGINEK